MINLTLLTWQYSLIYRSNALSIRNLVDFFVEIDNLILQFIWNCKDPRIGHSCPLKKSKTVRFQNLLPKKEKNLLQSNSNPDTGTGRE